MKTVIPYPGGKKRIADWIIGYMPEHHSYLEPYFGGGAVFFRKEAAPIETINDMDSDVVNFFRTIKYQESRAELLETVCVSKAKIMLSGYDCGLYGRYLEGWNKVQIPARAQNNLRRTETLWMNY